MLSLDCIQVSQLQVIAYAQRARVIPVAFQEAFDAVVVVVVVMVVVVVVLVVVLVGSSSMW